MGLFYDLLYCIAAVLLSPFWLVKKRSGWGERFGKIEPLPEAKKKRVLLHAVSVGEVNAIRPLVPKLAGRYDIVISATTDTGIARAHELFDDSANVVRYPLDFSWAVRRFLDAVQPDLVALTELEVWPNFARACRKRRVPLCIVNGRLSSRSFGRYRIITPILWFIFRRLVFVAVQDETYATRFRKLGVRKDRLHVTGSMKWDANDFQTDPAGAERLAKRFGIDSDRLLVVGGSTAPDEHRMLHDATPRGTQLLCAPRRPEWFDDAAEELHNCIRFTESDKPILASSKTERFLLDTIGELRNAYELADIVVIGRSFGRLHGSDPMEPAALGCAVMIGPAWEDFDDAVQALKQRDAIVETTRGDFKADLAKVINDASRRKALQQNALDCVNAMRGASERNTKLIVKALVGEAKAKSGRRRGKRNAA